MRRPGFCLHSSNLGGAPLSGSVPAETFIRQRGLTEGRHQITKTERKDYEIHNRHQECYTWHAPYCSFRFLHCCCNITRFRNLGLQSSQVVRTNQAGAAIGGVRKGRMECCYVIGIPFFTRSASSDHYIEATEQVSRITLWRNSKSKCHS